MRPARPLAVAAVAAAALVLTGCTSEPVDDAAPAPSPSPTVAPGIRALKVAAALTGLASRGRYELRSTTTVGEQDVVLAADGSYDWSRDLGRTTYLLPTGAVEQRLVGADLFFVLPQQAGIFFKLPAAQVAATPLGGTVDPTSHLWALGAARDVEEVDQQEVRGVATTRYRGEYDVAGTLLAANGLQDDVVRSSLGPPGDVARVPFEVWIDEGGLVRRFEQRVEVSTGTTVTTTVELFDFGREVVATLPPPEVVRDGAPLLEAIRTSLNRTTPTPPTPPAPAAPAPAASPA